MDTAALVMPGRGSRPAGLSFIYFFGIAMSAARGICTWIRRMALRVQGLHFRWGRSSCVSGCLNKSCCQRDNDTLPYDGATGAMTIPQYHLR